MTSRRSSGSSRAESAVEPMRSQNITLSGRRSAVVSAERRVPVGLAGESGEDRTRSSASMVWERKAAIASNRRRRWRIELTPMSLSSSAVSVGKTSASTSFSRNAASYCSRPKLFSHTPTSTTVASGLVMRAAEDYAGEPPTSRQRRSLLHVWAAPGAQEFFCLIWLTARVRSCVRPLKRCLCDAHVQDCFFPSTLSLTKAAETCYNSLIPYGREKTVSGSDEAGCRIFHQC